MNLSKARELREQRKKICEQANAVLDNNQLTAEERNKQFDTMMADADRLKTDIDRHERLETLEAEMRGTSAPPNGQPDGGVDEPEIGKERERRYREAWARCMQFGFDAKPHLRIRGISHEDRALLTQRMVELPAELRDMSTQGGAAYPGGVGSAGGFFVPTGFVNDVEQALKYYGPMLAGDGTGRDGLPTIMDTATGQPLPYPTSNDTAVVGERLGENQPAAGADVTLGMIMLGAYMYSTKFVKVSIALLQDSAFNIQQFLTDRFGERLGRILNTDFTVGAGSGGSAPNGVITAATAGPIAVGANANDGASGINSIGSDDLVSLEHSVDILYRRGAKYMAHDTTIGALKKIKDKYGRPLWLPGVALNAPDTLNGYSYAANNDMDQIPVAPNSPITTKKVMLFGQVSKYLIRRVKELSVLRLDERFAEYGQVAFLGFARYDGNLLDAGTAPVKYLRIVY